MSVGLGPEWVAVGRAPLPAPVLTAGSPPPNPLGPGWEAVGVAPPVAAQPVATGPTPQQIRIAQHRFKRARENQPRGVFWAENTLREWQQKYGDEIPRSKIGLFETARKTYEQWLRENPKAADEEFDKWRSGKRIRSVLHPEEIRLNEEALKDPEKAHDTRRLWDSVSEAMVSRYNQDEDVSGAVTYGLKRLPFGGSAVSAAEYLYLRKAVQNVASDKATNSDWSTIADTIHTAETSKDRSALAKVFDIVSMLPAFGTEIAMTGGAFTAGRQGAAKLAERGAGKLLQSQVIKGLAKTLPGRATVWAGTKLAPRAVGLAVQTAVNVPLVAGRAAEKWMPEYNLTRDEADQLSLVITDTGPSFTKALAKGFGAAATEIGTEYSGALLGKAGSALAKSKAGQALAKMPIPQRIAGFKAAVANRLLKKGSTAAQVREILRKGQIHGMVPELFEERVGELVGGVTGIEDNYGATGQILSGDSAGWEQLLTEAAAFAVIPAGMTAAASVDQLAASLDRLHVIRSKGFVSVADGRELSLSKEQMVNRDTRDAAAAELEQVLEQEIHNASQVFEDQIVPEETGEVRPGSEADRGSDVYQPGEGQVPAQPAGQEPAARTEVPDVEQSEVTQLYLEAEEAGEIGYKPKKPRTPEELEATVDYYKKIFTESLGKSKKSNTSFVGPGSIKQRFYEALAKEAGGTIVWTDIGGGALTGKFQAAQESTPTSVSPPVAETPVPAGHTRLYRVRVAPEFVKEKPKWVKQAHDASGQTAAEGRWFVEDPTMLDWYKEEYGEHGQVVYVDVPSEEAERYRVSNLAEDSSDLREANENKGARSFSRDPQNEFFLPGEMAGSALPLFSAQTEQAPASAAPLAASPPAAAQKQTTAEAPFSTPAWREKRVAELVEKRAREGRRGPKAEALIQKEVDEELRLLEQYPPGTTLTIDGYKGSHFRVEPDGRLYEMNSQRFMGDNAGSVLRHHKPGEIHVSQPAAAPAGAPAAPKAPQKAPAAAPAAQRPAAPRPAPVAPQAPKKAPAAAPAAQPAAAPPPVPRPKKQPQKAPVDRFLDDLSDEDVKQVAARLGIKTADRAGVLKAIQDDPELKAFVEEHLPAEGGTQLTPGRPGKHRSRQQLKEDLETAFVAKPGSVDVQDLPGGDGWQVTLPNGKTFKAFRLRAGIKVNVKAAAKAYGVSEAEIQKMIDRGGGAAGASGKARSVLVLDDGTIHTFDEIGIALDPSRADSTTARHEALHLAQNLGFFTTPEGKRIWDALIKKFGNEERIAEARAIWDGPDGLWAKIREFIRRVMEPLRRAVGMGMSPSLAMSETFGEKFWEQKDYRNPEIFPGTSAAGPLTPAGGIAFQFADVERTKLEVKGRGLPATVGANLEGAFNGLKQWLYTELTSLSDMVDPKCAWHQPTEGQSLIEYGRRFFSSRGIAELKRTFKGDRPPSWVADKKLWQDIKNDLRIAEKIAAGKYEGGIRAGWAKRFLSTNIKTGGYSWDFALMTCMPTERCSVCYAKGMATQEVTISKARLRHTIVTALHPEVVGKAIGQWVSSQPKGNLPLLRVNGAGDSTFRWQIDAINACIEVLDRPMHIFSRSHVSRSRDSGSLADISNGHYDPANPAGGCVVYKMGSVDKQLRDEYGDDFLKENLEKRGIINSYLMGAVEDVAIVREMREKGIFMILHINTTNSVVQAIDEAGLLATSDRPNSMIAAPACACALETGPKINGCATCLMSQGPCFAWGVQIAMTPKGELYTYNELMHGSRERPTDRLVPMSQIGVPTGGARKQISHDVIAVAYEHAAKHLRDTISGAVRLKKNINIYNPRSRETIATLKPTKANVAAARRIAKDWEAFATQLREGKAAEERVQKDWETTQGFASMDRAAERFAGRDPGVSYQLAAAQEHLENEPPTTYTELSPEEVPTKTQRAYKLMRRMPSRPGLLFPLFVSAKEGAFRKGRWYKADAKAPRIGGKTLANRPGIHAVDAPIFSQGKPAAKGQNRVWVEVELPAMSEATQQESDNSPVLRNGTQTGIATRLIGPQEAYNYQTTKNAKGAGVWPIAGSMKVVRVLSDADVREALEKAGKSEWVEKSLSGESGENAAEWNINYALDPGQRPVDALLGFLDKRNKARALESGIGIKKERLAMQAAAMGMAPPNPAESVQAIELVNEAVANITQESDAEIQERAAEIVTNPSRSITLEEAADLLASVHYHRLKADEAANRHNDYLEKGETAAAAAAGEEENLHRAAMYNVGQAARIMGSQWAYMGHIYQVIVDKDGQAYIEQLLRKANNGQAAPSDSEWAKQHAKALSDAKGKQARRGAKIDEEQSVAQADDKVAELTGDIKREETQSRKARGSRNRFVTEKAKDAAIRRIRERLKNMRTTASATPVGTSVEMLADAAVVAGYHIEAGARRMAEFASAMVRDLGDWVEPHLDDLYRKTSAEYATAYREVLHNRMAKASSLQGQRRAVSLLAKQILIETRLPNGEFIHRDKLLEYLHDELQKVDENITHRETRDLFSGYGDRKDLSQDDVEVAARDRRGESRVLSQIDDLLLKRPPKPSGVEQHTPSAEERRLSKKVRELKKKGEREGWYYAGDKESRLKGTLESRKTRLLNQIEDLEDQMTAGVKTVKNKTEPLTDTELENLKARYKECKQLYDEMFKVELTDEQRAEMYEQHLARQIGRIREQIKTGKVFPEEKAFVPVTAKAAALQAELAALMAEKNALRKILDPEYETNQKIARAEKQAERELAKLEEERAEGYKMGEAPSPLPMSDRLRDAREKLRIIRAERRAALNDEYLLKAAIAQSRRAAADAADRLARGDFAPRHRKPARIWNDPEWRQAKDEELALREKLALKIAEYEWNNMGNWETAGFALRVGEAVWKAWLTSWDASMVGLQAGYTFVTRPQDWVRAMVPAAQAMGSAKARARIDAERQAKPQYEQFMQWGLALSEHGKRGGVAVTEMYPTERILDAVPGVAFSERAFSTFLNELRFNVMEALSWCYSKPDGRQLDETTGAALARVVNAMTFAWNPQNRKARVLLEAASHFAWAPSMYAARVQVLTGSPVWFNRGADARIRKIAAWQFLKGHVGMTLLYLLARWLWDDDEEIDVRSSDFGKVKKGDVRVDVTSGLAQTAVLGARLASKKTVTSEGEEKDTSIRPLLTTFGGFKLAPWVTTLLDLWDGTDMLGRPATFTSELVENLTPLSLQNAIESYEERGLVGGTGLSILGLVGKNVSIYNQSSPKSEETFLATARRLAEKMFGAEPKGLSLDDFEKWVTTKVQWDTDLSKADQYLNPDQRVWAREKQQEKKEDAIMAATRPKPSPENHRTSKLYRAARARWKKARERLRAMQAAGITYDQAQQLLLDHYLKPDKDGNVPMLDTAHGKKAAILDDLYDQPAGSWNKWLQTHL